ncbi:MAG TPA: VWA domain-containing protein [Thermoanaerobaculia bacterium]|nr:VWA domain-containing protein [Thermoanaerobaculia bacterium]
MKRCEIEWRAGTVISFMRITLLLLFACLVALPLPAQGEPDVVTIELSPLGDAGEGVVTRVTLRLRVPDSVQSVTPLAVQGSILQGTSVVRNFRYLLPETERARFSFIVTLPAGVVTIEARLMIPLEEEAPMLLGKGTVEATIAGTGQPYIASESDGPEGFVAEGLVPEISGALKLKPPRRDLAPNLFLVDVEVKDPIRRVEFYVDGKLILAKNAPPYRTELDLGKIPRRVEVRVVGYDAKGRYVDADAWIVNERDTPLEVKITRTVTPDGVSHFKLSIQNPNGRELKTIELFAGDRKVMEWNGPPYAISIPTAQLGGVEFVRASVLDDTNYEASDLLFLDGSRFSEEIDVNLVELPISVTDERGVPIIDLKQENFTVFEDGKPQKIASFGFASDLPISVGVLVDHSGSMRNRLDTARQAAIDFFQQIIGPKDRAFFGAFAWDPSSISPFVSNIEALRSQAVRMPSAEGGTSLYDAVVSGLYRFRNVAGRKALIIVTDGEDTTSRLGYDEMIHYARAARVPLYFIAVGMSGFDLGASSKMRSMAAETGGIAYFIRNVGDLKDTYARLEAELRTQYLIGYYAESSRNDDRYRTVDVKSDRKGAKVRTIRGFIP